MNKQLLNKKPIYGTRDFYPEEMRVREYIWNIWETVTKSYNFLKYDAPIIESIDLYTRKGSDDILKEMYTFKTENKTVALRPEMTPSLVRMIMNLRVTQPLKYCSISQCWRFETTSRLRGREHYQLNCDVVAGDKLKSEMEILSLLVNIFKKFGLTSDDIVIQFSYRPVIEEFLEKMNIQDTEKVFNIIDKMDKISHDEIINKLNEIQNFELDKIHTFLEFINQNDFQNEYINKILELANHYEIRDWLKVDLKIVRGLSYYTGIVFECFCKNEELGIKRAICGGGQYDNIMKNYGSKVSHTFIGFGMGDIVLEQILIAKKLIPVNTGIDYCILYSDETLYPHSFKIANRLRQKYVVDINVKKMKIKNAFAYAESVNAKYAILIAPSEYLENKIVIKNMNLDRDDPNKQITVNIEEFLQSLNV